MGGNCSLTSPGAARRPTAQRECPGCPERDSVCSGDGLPVAPDPQGCAAAEYLSCVPSTMGLGWHAGAHPLSSLPTHARARRAGSQPERCGCGPSKRPICLKRGAYADVVGDDAGKKVKGVKYQILVDTLGLMLNIVVHSADIQDRDGAALVLDKKTRQTFPFIEVVYADGGYQGDKAAEAVAAVGTWQLLIVKRSDRAKGFVVLPKRWVVERTLSWLSRCRRLVRNHELYHRTAVAFIRLAMIRLMLRRLSESAVT